MDIFDDIEDLLMFIAIIDEAFRLVVSFNNDFGYRSSLKSFDARRGWVSLLDFEGVKLLSEAILCDMLGVVWPKEVEISLVKGVSRKKPIRHLSNGPYNQAIKGAIN